MQTISKEFTKEMYDLIDKKHKEDLRKVDYQYRSLKDSITKWSSGKDVYGYEIDKLGIEGEKNEKNLERLLEELRAD
jgi:hypothetical protein|tara:strand:- start:106 stop:336 length:231 start_codon:yes stop_codon:yes gene_type:complete